ncbi:MAG TPA: GAF and ANTAR domain-containing protein [Glaciibacter sp.]|nr:GAF and ANTAR domain-containing protein [Glaciibacter sp.]
MSAKENFTTAMTALSSALERNTSLCAPFLNVLGVDGAAISTLGVPFGSETMCASDRLAARLDEVQIDLGEGPCWQAQATRRPVLSPDIREAGCDAWPVFAEAIRDDDVGALHAFPLLIGPLSVGAIDLYFGRAGSLSDDQVADATDLAAIAARQVLRRALSAREPKSRDEASETDTEYSRRVVDQATGMLLAQLDVSATDALLILRGHAFAHGRSVRAIAGEIVERRLDLAHWHEYVEN